jgi:hypothetical protein
MRETWAPWTPKVGQRVRVRVSLECQYCLDPRFRQCYERALADDGRTATVYSVGHDECSCRYDGDDPPDAGHVAHDVWVKWDDRRSYDDPVVRVGDWECPFDAHFAAAELEPVS